MGKVVDMLDGTASLGVYLVQYDEDRFLRYSDKDKEFCYAQWIKKAKPQGCKRLVVKLVPDPIFPLHEDKPLPYVYYQQEIVQDELVGFKCEAVVYVILDAWVTEIDVPLRRRIETALMSYPNGTQYYVKTDKMALTSLMQGKVAK